jgi:hypothetical protein
VASTVYSDDFEDLSSDDEVVEEAKHNAMEARLARLGEKNPQPFVTQEMFNEYMDAGEDTGKDMDDSSEASFENDPVSSSMGVNAFDDDEEEKASQMSDGEAPEDEYDSGEEEEPRDDDAYGLD